MHKPVIGVFFGSRSTEHDISIITALSAVIKPLELSQRFTVIPVYIAKDGQWYSDPALTDITLFTKGNIDDWCRKQQPIQLGFSGGLQLVRKGLRQRTVTIDVAFPATHGTHGEDGELMAVFELANIPYVGCTMPASAIAMDKVLAKQIAAASAIPITKFVAFTKHDFEANPTTYLKQIKARLTYPLFVKPAHLGSSIGIARVGQQSELANAIEVALHYDDKALVEEAVQNLIEVTLPIMGNDELTPALLEQPLTQSDDFFDFETKYMNGGKKGKASKASAQGYSQIPADLPADLYKKAETIGLDTYRALGCGGMARVDMLIDSKLGTVYFNEVNPLPGSLYAHNWAQAGISGVSLVIKLVQLAQERHAAKAKTATVFTTNYLKQY